MKHRDIAAEDRSAPGRQNGHRKRLTSGFPVSRARRTATYAQTMSIELIVGPPNSGRSEAILARFRAELGRDPVLVVPTADDVAAFERELAAQGATLGGSIATFDALAAEIAAALAPALDPELTVSQRQALVRAAIDSVDPGRLRRSAARPGFAPALARLIAELEAALVSPARVRGDRRRARRRRIRARARAVSIPATSSCARRADAATGRRRSPRRSAPCATTPTRGGARPVFVYGFDDLTRAQRELVDALAGAGDGHRRGHLRRSPGADAREHS